MKIKKLEALMSQHAWLANYLAHKRHLYAYKRGGERQIREFRDYVRQNVSYVAFRPWESLDFLDRTRRESQNITERRHMLHRCIDYEVLWHSDTTLPFQEQKSLMHNERNPSVGQLIGDLVMFRLNYPTTDKEIHFDAVVRHSYTHSTILGDYTDEQWEIFLCPKDWVLEWMKKDQDLHRQLQAKNIKVQGLVQTA